MAPSASPFVTLAMIVLPLGMAATLTAAYARAGRGGSAAGEGRRRALFALGATAWLALPAALAAAGALARFDLRPAPLMPLMLLLLGCTVALARSAAGARLAEGLPLWALVAMQGFRLPLELVMHRAASEGVMPVQMSFSGYNFDILTGATALLLAPLLASGRAGERLARAWNWLGSALLLVIVSIAAASTPPMLAFGPERANTWIAHAPFVWLPTFLVPAALLGHLLVFRRLGAAGHTARPAPAAA